MRFHDRIDAGEQLAERLTKYAGELEQLQDDYLDCWRGLRKHFDPGSNKP